MRTVGYAVDAALLATSFWLASRHPGWQWAEKHGGVLAGLAALPTPVVPGNVTGFVADVNGALGFPLQAGSEATAQAWFNYLVGDDLGQGQTSSELASFVAVNQWKNSLFLPLFMRNNLPHVVAIWARNMVAGWLLYWITGGLWALWMYVIAWRRYYKSRADMPSWEDMSVQIGVSTRAMIFYSLAPTFGEWAIERGLTLSYHSLDAVGGIGGYVAYLVAYMVFVVSRPPPVRVFTPMASTWREEGGGALVASCARASASGGKVRGGLVPPCVVRLGLLCGVL